MGELIVGKTFKKVSFDSITGKLVENEYTVSGRKIPFDEIRKLVYEEHKAKGILKPVEGNILNRYLIIWGDHASVLIFGFLLYTIKVLYSENIFMTDEEYKKSSGKALDVQSFVEKP